MTTGVERSDRHWDEWLRAAAEGDNVAARAFVEHTMPMVTRLCRVMGSVVDCDDLVQETYLRAFASARTFRGEAPALAWLLGVARRVCADHVRRQVRRRRLWDRLSAQRCLTADTSNEADAGVTESLLAELDADRREAFVLTQLIGLSYEQAASVVDVPVGTIRSRVARARDDLRQLVNAARAV
jgi:RNA polymerase sigma-70 factor, ECF subfamily